MREHWEQATGDCRLNSNDNIARAVKQFSAPPTTEQQYCKYFTNAKTLQFQQFLHVYCYLTNPGDILLKRKGEVV